MRQRALRAHSRRCALRHALPPATPRTRAEDPHAVAELKGESLGHGTRDALAVEAAEGARAVCVSIDTGLGWVAAHTSYYADGSRKNKRSIRNQFVAQIH
eukprot:5252388-Prymnesium_polylepis.1